MRQGLLCSAAAALLCVIVTSNVSQCRGVTCSDHLACNACTGETCSFCGVTTTKTNGGSFKEGGVCVPQGSNDGSECDGVTLETWGTMIAFTEVSSGHLPEGFTVAVAKASGCSGFNDPVPHSQFITPDKDTCLAQASHGWCDFTVKHSSQTNYVGGECRPVDADALDVDAQCPAPQLVSELAGVSGFTIQTTTFATKAPDATTTSSAYSTLSLSSTTTKLAIAATAIAAVLGLVV